MTSLNTIKEFMVSNPKFPYHLLMRLYPIEMAAVLEAFMTVGERRFYGYRKDPGVAKSTNYRNITWVAKTVLEKQGGGTHLREYRGFKANPDQEGTVMPIIDKYLLENRSVIDEDTPAHDNETRLQALLLAHAAVRTKTDEPRKPEDEEDQGPAGGDPHGRDDGDDDDQPPGSGGLGAVGGIPETEQLPSHF